MFCMTSRFRCSVAASTQPMAGTAATDAGFLLIEHPGPWGSKALAESRLVPEEAKAALTSSATGHGVRIQLVRRPRERGGDRPTYRVFLAHPASGRLDVQELADRQQLATLDLDLTTRGPGLRPYAGGLVLVCTNGRRDACCAEFGRPVATAMAAELPEETWETTHLGGHRFAVAALTLPDGMSYGRIDAASGLAIAHAAARGEVVPALLRGRTAYPPARQAAEVALLEHLGLVAADALTPVEETSTGGVTTVTFDAAGATYDVVVLAEEQPPARQSCADLTGKPSIGYRVTAITARAGSAPAPR
jgi:hypothetical protein